jgi:membrane-bound lytic murein transglycosylase D
MAVCVAYNNSILTVWDVLRSQLKLDHHLNEPAVQKQIKWLANHPGYFKSLSNSEPYIYHIVSEIQNRKLPGELALLPMIESAFNPFAYSHSGAAGLWQFMPATGHDMGLKQNWWYDDRRNIEQSTKAALNYLNYLHDFFENNWNLAIAAYNAGEGAVSRTMARHSQSSKNLKAFWQLNSLPQETKDYVPRLLALAEIIKYPDYYHIKLPHIPYMPYFQEVKIHNQIDLGKAANLAGISFQELIKLNPAYNRWKTVPNEPLKLLIPQNKVDNFYHNLALLPSPNIMHNNLKKHKTISHINSNYKVLHIVQMHESYASIAQKYQVTPAKIRFWNNIPANKPLKVRQELIIWKKLHTIRHYRVAKNDTPERISKKFNISLKTLAALNHHVDLNNLMQGQDIVVS